MIGTKRLSCDVIIKRLSSGTVSALERVTVATKRAFYYCNSKPCGKFEMIDMIEKEDAVISEEEAAQYDRQIRLWGLDAQKRSVSLVSPLS